MRKVFARVLASPLMAVLSGHGRCAQKGATKIANHTRERVYVRERRTPGPVCRTRDHINVLPIDYHKSIPEKAGKPRKTTSQNLVKCSRKLGGIFEWRT